jgi:FAD/FMN-containing dehydrogenase
MSRARVRHLSGRVQGPVLLAGDDGFDQERAGFQTGLQHQPAMIVGAAGPADVSATVGFAGENGLPVLVQATGHGLWVPAEGGVLISTRRMNSVQVDGQVMVWMVARSCRRAMGLFTEPVGQRAAGGCHE